MAISVYIAKMTREASGRMTAEVIIQPSDLTAFRVQVVFDDKGNEESNLHHVQGVLQGFSHDLAEALRRPLKIVRKAADLP